MSTYPTDPTPMSDDPKVLRRQIEQTRSDLSRDVDALGEAASPGNVARRQAEKVSDTVTGAGRMASQALGGYHDPRPMVFSGLYPIDGSDYPVLRDALHMACVIAADANLVFHRIPPPCRDVISL